MKPRYFVNADTRVARLGYGKEWSREMRAQGFVEVTAEEFGKFREETTSLLVRQA